MSLLPKKKGTKCYVTSIPLLSRQTSPPCIKAHPGTAIHHTAIRRRVIILVTTTTIPIFVECVVVCMPVPVPMPKRRRKHKAIHDFDVAAEFLLVLWGRDAAAGVGRCEGGAARVVAKGGVGGWSGR
jgi:hypothetical protein